MGVPAEKVERAVDGAIRDVTRAMEHEDREQARIDLESLQQDLWQWKARWSR